MDIVIVSEFCEDFSLTDNDRFLYLAKMLANNSNVNNVEIITSSFRHTTKKHRRKPGVEWPFKITFLEEPGYPKNVCLRRFRSHYIWGKNVIEYIKKRSRKPDVVYCAIPSLTGPNLVAKYCEKEHIRFVIDVQDLWPEAFQMVVNIPIISSIAFAPFKILADGVYKRADAICAVSDTYCQRALKVNRKVKSGTTVFLGTELATFDRYAMENPILVKKNDEIWLGYAGTLGTSYNLPLVFDALRKTKISNLRFVIMGNGPLEEEYRKYAEGLNVTFTGRIPYEQMCSMLSVCDMVINPIIGLSVASIINKHADYAASGKPVINTQNSIEYQRLVDEAEMGINCSCNDADELIKAIEKLYEDKDLRERMGDNSRRCAQTRFDRAHTYKALCDVIINKSLKS